MHGAALDVLSVPIAAAMWQYMGQGMLPVGHAVPVLSGSHDPLLAYRHISVLAKGGSQRYTKGSQRNLTETSVVAQAAAGTS